MKWRQPCEADSQSLVRHMGKAFLQQARDEGFTTLELVVWENMGWHFFLRGDLLNFHPTRRGEEPRIWVLAGSKHEGAGVTGWFPQDVYETFTEAYNATLNCCKARVKEARDRARRIRAHRPKPKDRG